MAVGIGAALILDAVAPRRVVAVPAVVYPLAPVVVHTPPPVVHQPAPVIVRAPQYGAPLPVYYRDGRGKSHHGDSHVKRHWKARYKHHDHDD